MTDRFLFSVLEMEGYLLIFSKVYSLKIQETFQHIIENCCVLGMVIALIAPIKFKPDEYTRILLYKKMLWRNFRQIFRHYAMKFFDTNIFLAMNFLAKICVTMQKIIDHFKYLFCLSRNVHILSVTAHFQFNGTKNSWAVMKFHLEIICY